MAHEWDPGTYLRYADERARPFVDLMARVAADAPAYVADLGCGPGNLTVLLRRRWPQARIDALDSSEPMIAQARQDFADSGIAFTVGDLRSWRPPRPVDVLVSNATLQWVPEHLELLPRLAEHVAAGGWLAFQVPGNFGEPSHVLLRELAASNRYAVYTDGIRHPASHDPQTYLDVLAGIGWRVDAWETTYLHVLTGPDPVLRWISGTGARPVLQTLPDGVREEFEREYAEALRSAYPARDFGTVLPFRRVFVVAHRDAAR